MNLNYLFAVVIAFGGVFAFAKTQSVASLLSSGVFSILIGLTAKNAETNPTTGYYWVCLVDFALFAMMGYRFYLSGKFMPAGLVTVLSLGMLVKNYLAMSG